MTAVGMIGDGEEFWIHHNLYYHLIFKFIITEIWEGRIQLFLISNIDIINVVILTGVKSKGRKQLRIHLCDEITKAMETIY